MAKSVPTKLADFRPKFNRISEPKEIELLKLACGYRQCTSSSWDVWLNYYFIAILGTILFILLSLDVVDKFLSQFTSSKVQQLIFKAVIFLVILYLADRLIEEWRTNNVLCKITC